MKNKDPKFAPGAKSNKRSFKSDKPFSDKKSDSRSPKSNRFDNSQDSGYDKRKPSGEKKFSRPGFGKNNVDSYRNQEGQDNKPKYGKKITATKRFDSPKEERFDKRKPNSEGGYSKPGFGKNKFDSDRKNDRSEGNTGYPKKTYGSNRFDNKSDSKSTYGRKPSPRNRFSDNADEKAPSFERKSSSYDRSEGKTGYPKKTYGSNRFDNKSDSKSTYSRKPSPRNRFSDNADEKAPSFERKSGGYGKFKDRGESKSFDNRNTSDKKWPKKQGGFDAKPPRKFGDNSFKNNRRKRDEEEFKEEEKFDWPIRLNRFVSNAGICSRRDADALIEKGLFQINGKEVTELGAKVNKKDVVTYKGKKILPELPVYILINKPKDCITTTSDEAGRRTVMDLVTEATDARIYPVGRLDRNTTGVLLLTNDGEVAQKLTHPSFEIRKVYEVTLEEKASVGQLEQLAAGIELEDGVSFADSVAFPDPTNKRVVGIEIHSGKNRIVRRMFEALGHQVVKLDRVMFGPFTKKGLDRGKYRFLKNSEISQLKRAKKRL
jgi:23S rRNA pseudouridine2605 synthase